MEISGGSATPQAATLSPSIFGRVFHTCVSKRNPSFVALAALPAVEVARGADARESVSQWQRRAAANHVRLVQAGIRTNDPHRTTNGAIDRPSELVEELGCRIGEGIHGQWCHCDFRHVVQVAPE